ncbi:MAG: phosphotransferase [Ardenticatenaceae bacterium]|nr:phosphotransferase [Ardenticatenaceae bacterium]MCB9446206.1 phosphotransferase [Ardenticatenaceae bacterium]
MEQAIRERYNDNILQEAQRRYGILPENCRELGGFESFMYEFSRGDSAYILRIGHSKRRTVELIQGEVDWINYLAAGGAGVARAVLSNQGNLVEPIDDGHDGRFLATAFVKAPGGNPWQMQKWDETLFERYGRLLGRIHRLSQAYELPNPKWKRPSWDDPIMRVENWLPPEEKLAQEKFLATIQYLQSLPQNKEGYGLIHQDAHGGNFFVDDDYNITLFDFDDCAYGHYVYDIAMALFYAVTNRPDAEEFGPHFFEHFMRGYHQENQLDSRWIAEIPHFLKLREFDLYAVIFRSFDVNNLDEHPWVATFMNGRKQRLENNVPYLAMDFATLSQ